MLTPSTSWLILVTVSLLCFCRSSISSASWKASSSSEISFNVSNIKKDQNLNDRIIYVAIRIFSINCFHWKWKQMNNYQQIVFFLCSRWSSFYPDLQRPILFSCAILWDVTSRRLLLRVESRNPISIVCPILEILLCIWMGTLLSVTKLVVAKSKKFAIVPIFTLTTVERWNLGGWSRINESSVCIALKTKLIQRRRV